MIMNKQKLSNAVVLALLFLVCLPTLFPIIAAPLTTLPYPDNGDVKLSLTILHSHLTKASHLQWNQIYHLPIIYPLSYTLTAGISLFGQTLFFLPLFLLGIRNFYLLYNIAVLASFVLAGFGAFLFFRETMQARSRSAPLAGAMLYILLPFRVHNIPHLNILFNFPIPFCFFYLLRYLKRKKTGDLLLVAIFLLLQFLSDISLGIYLSLSLGLFFLIYWIIGRDIRWKEIAKLAAAMAGVLIILMLLFHPYLQKQTSFSRISGEFKATQYLPSSSFFVTWSYPLQFIGRIAWDTSPQFPGFIPAFFFLLAIWPFLGKKSERIVFGVNSVFLILPALFAIVTFDHLSSPYASAVTDVSLFLFFASLAVLTVLLWRKLPPVLKMIIVIYTVSIFVFFRPFSYMINSFSLLSRLLPFIVRLRGIHSPYIFQLFFALLAAFGFANFQARVKGKQKLLYLLIALFFVEKWRWPIATGRLAEDTGIQKNLYQRLSPFPSHYGLLELPLIKPFSNNYSLYTRNHNLHTYHGGLGVVTDVLKLSRSSTLTLGHLMAGLGDPKTIQSLKDIGVRVLIVNRSFPKETIPGRSRHSKKYIQKRIWEAIALGREKGLYERVEDYPEGAILLIDGAETGRNIRHFIPYYALISPRRMKLKIEAGQPTRTALFFNRSFLREYPLEPGVTEISLEIKRLSAQPQFNYLNLKSESAVTLREVDFSAD